MTKGFSPDTLKPSKYDGDTKWTVSADLRSMETFYPHFDSNYDIVDKLKEKGVLSKKTEEDSEMCQFFAYFSTKNSAENFIKKLCKYVEQRKVMVKELYECG